VAETIGDFVIKAPSANLLILFFGKKGWPQLILGVFRMTLTRLQKLFGHFFQLFMKFFLTFLDYFSGGFLLVLFRFLVVFGLGLGRLLQKELRLGVDGFGLGAYISPSRRSKTTLLVRETSGG
jgi:hypothetical protein